MLMAHCDILSFAGVSRLWRFSRDAGSRLELDLGEAARTQKRHDPREISPEAVERIRRHLDES